MGKPTRRHGKGVVNDKPSGSMTEEIVEEQEEKREEQAPRFRNQEEIISEDDACRERVSNDMTFIFAMVLLLSLIICILILMIPFWIRR